MTFSCDFETTTDRNDCRVWAYGIAGVGYDSFKYGNSIDDFMNEVLNSLDYDLLYFHNLKFDGEFIIHWLFTHGYKHVESKKELGPNCFTTLINDMGLFYSMEIECPCGFKSKPHRLKIYDSMKVLPFSVKQIAKSFGLEMTKGEIDYTAYRPVGHKITREELDYLYRDCKIVAKALDEFFRQGLTKMTQASNALAEFKRIFGSKNFERHFPQLDYHREIKQAYKGGFTYLNPLYTCTTVNNINVLDVNSLYPSRMRNCLLPYGHGKLYNGEYVYDKEYPLYIQMLSCQFEIKENHIPTIQIKGSFRFAENEYVRESGEEEIVLCLTNVDLELFLKHYNVYNIKYIKGWKFRGSTNLFREYIDKWYGKKTVAKQEGNYGLMMSAKLMLNALYGKFGTSDEVISKIPYLDTDTGIVKYRKSKPESKNTLYMPIAAFITAYARHLTITSSQKITDYSIEKYGKDLYVYSDTDSIHSLISIEELSEILEVSKTKLGAWKHEGSFTRGKFIRQKCYIEEEEIGKEEYEKYLASEDITNNRISCKNDRYYFMHITCAGMPSRCYNNVSWQNFIPGSSFAGKLVPEHVPGGVVLKNVDFTIKL